MIGARIATPRFLGLSSLLVSLATGVLSLSTYGFAIVLAITVLPMQLVAPKPISRRKAVLLDCGAALIIILSVYHMRSLGMKVV